MTIAAVVSEPVTDLVIDPRTGWLDDVLAGLADGVADCANPREAGEVPDAVRIDRIARLEKIKAAAAALQIAESVRFGRSQVQAQLAADVHPEDGPWDSRSIGLSVPNIRLRSRPSARSGEGVVVRPAGDIPTVGRRRY